MARFRKMALTGKSTIVYHLPDPNDLKAINSDTSGCTRFWNRVRMHRRSIDDDLIINSLDKRLGKRFQKACLPAGDDLRSFAVASLHFRGIFAARYVTNTNGIMRTAFKLN